ncbi:Exodeoxyribonuclease VII large subunit [Terribacillus aidingensis]|uniref:Exodeoxyribonuclease 7 large subunit n=1 Tax=Terribacillus aidingensis TaxID=586416 RepID=A0A285NS80_9BACI|nr:exodeoxyribonuclease VII large subunit [Terribacillus aidingensis]SNZ10686.1 Exodeoxyribonuclease VII large subunit [Terribacillus aidingensis]
MSDDRYLTVTALTRYMKRKLETDKHLKDIWLRAEISNFKHHSRGHMYMTLKDDGARIQSVMFAGQNKGLKFTPENGMTVLIRAEIGLYEPQGQYQLYIQHMEPDGVGALYQAYEQLKEKLDKEGLFSAVHKKPLPAYPEHIGVITSPTGAAVRDILTTIRRRYPIVKVTVLPVAVQGERSAPSLVQALSYAENHNFDVLIIGRGGGSIEELWSFNEESVARAIHKVSIPVISAVGHETDFTISDFVADVRAATPTGAAEMAVPAREELLHRLTQLRNRMQYVVRQSYRQEANRLAKLKASYAFRYPEQMLRQKEIELDKLSDRLSRSGMAAVTAGKQRFTTLANRLSLVHPGRQAERYRQQLDALEHRLRQAMGKQHERKQQKFVHQLNKLSLLNPLETMKRGYSISYKQDTILKSVAQVTTGDDVQIHLADGTIDCIVKDVKEDTNG